MTIPALNQDPITPFFLADEEKKRILTFKDATKESLLSSGHRKVWTVTWLTLQVPLRLPLFILARIVALGARCCHAKSLENRTKIISYHLLAPYLNKMFTHLMDVNNELVATTINIQKLETLGLVGTAPIKYENIQNTKLKELLHSDWKEFGFAHLNGACRGASWLYLKLHAICASEFKDPYALHYAISQEFSQGIPKTATYLHSLYKSEKALSLVKKKTTEFSLAEINTSPDNFNKFIKKLPVGRYFVSLPDLYGSGHAVCLIKETNNSLFFFDIDRGTFAPRRETISSQFQQTLNILYGKDAKLSGNISFTKVDLIPPEEAIE